MNLLLDTHALIWFVSGDRRLGRAARAAMEHDQARLHISAASVWEMAVKSALKRLELPHPVQRYVADRIDEGYVVLNVDWAHAAAVEHLPFHHRDPFDRLLVAQAKAARVPVVTRDRVFKKYRRGGRLVIVFAYGDRVRLALARATKTEDDEAWPTRPGGQTIASVSFGGNGRGSDNAVCFLRSRPAIAWLWTTHAPFGPAIMKAAFLNNRRGAHACPFVFRTRGRKLGE